MTRIIAGTAGGRRLEVPKGVDTRPTSDRVREALFSVLDARCVVLGARVLDLYSGSGALGLEAASRGAADVVLVDSSRQASEAARRNVAALGMPRVSVVLSSVLRFLEGRPDRPFSLILLDPPYPMAEEDLGAVLTALDGGGWVGSEAMVIVERSSRGSEPRWPPGLIRESVRRYGDTALWAAVRAPR